MSDIGATVTAQHEDHEIDYASLLDTVRNRFDRLTGDGERLFVVDTDHEVLWQAYLDNIPGGEIQRQIHNCNCCKTFIRRFGSVVTISDDGELKPVMWEPGLKGFYAPAFNTLHNLVRKAKIVSVFATDEKRWGTRITPDPKTGKVWSHFHVEPAPVHLHTDKLRLPNQVMALKRENYKDVRRALVDFKPEVIDEALRAMKLGVLENSERYVAPLTWLRSLHDRPKGRAGDNILWKKVAAAPEAYCHPRASSVGTLMDDIKAGLTFDAMKAKFNSKMAPLKFQRPKAAPTRGSINRAEQIFEKLKLEPSLHRRYARLEEIPLIWSPSSPSESAKPAGGVFSHLAAKDEKKPSTPLNIPEQTMTWVKFARDFLPNATKIEVYVTTHSNRFIAVTTAVNSDAPPIFKWDFEDHRWPIGWYVYPGGSPASQWNLRSESYVEATGISRFPTMLGKIEMPHEGDGAVIYLKNAMDSSNPSSALFPVMMRSELREVSSVIEAHSKSSTVHGKMEGSACGWDMRRDTANVRLRVTGPLGVNRIYIDRWE